MLDARLLKLPTASHHHRHEHHQIVVGVRGEADLSVDGTGSHLDTWRACLVPTEARHDYCGDLQNHVLVINLDPYMPAINSPGHSEYETLAPLFERPRTLVLDNKLQGWFSSWRESSIARRIIRICCGTWGQASCTAWPNA